MLRADCAAILRERAVELGVLVMYGIEIRAVDVEGPGVLLSGGRNMAADLVIGADGRRCAMSLYRVLS